MVIFVEERIFAGQNKNWGTVEEATETWLRLGIDHLMIKQTPDLSLVDSDGQVKEEDFEKLAELQEKYGVRYHLHPYDLNSEVLIDQDLLLQFDRMVQKYGLYPLITIHLARYSHPKYGAQMDEGEALLKSETFFQNLELNCKLALETMHDPGRNPGYSLLGYKSSHFMTLLNGRDDLGLCLDFGHMKMAEEYSMTFLNLPFEILSLHVETNDESKDCHWPLTRENVGKDEVLLREAIKFCRGPIVIETKPEKGLAEVKKSIDFCRELASWEV